MNKTTVAKILAAAPSTVTVIPQKGYIQLVGPGGAKLYVKQPRKSDDVCPEVHVSGWAYGGLPAHLQLPAEVCEAVTDNGAVSHAVDLTKAPKDWLARAVEHLATAEAEADTRRASRARAKRASSPSLADLIASARASSAAAQEAVEEDAAEDDGSGI